AGDDREDRAVRRKRGRPYVRSRPRLVDVDASLGHRQGARCTRNDTSKRRMVATASPSSANFAARPPSPRRGGVDGADATTAAFTFICVRSRGSHLGVDGAGGVTPGGTNRRVPSAAASAAGAPATPTLTVDGAGSTAAGASAAIARFNDR